MLNLISRMMYKRNMSSTDKKTRIKRSVIWTTSQEELVRIINECDTYSAVLQTLGYTNRGSAFRILKERIEADKINDTHLQKGKRRLISPKKLPDDVVFMEQSTYLNGQYIKKRLLQKGIEDICSICGLSNEWCGQTLTLQLDHINGVRNDNRLENLRILCPNCHSQTYTFAGKNAISEQKKLLRQKVEHKGKEVSLRQKQYYDSMTAVSRPSHRKIERPDQETLQRLLWEMPTTKIAAMYSVSDKAVEKWSVAYNLTKPPRGYWTKRPY